jgi:methionyl-tRNA formyltransferase
MTENSYIFASCKSWHDKIYDNLVHKIRGRWMRASNKSELEKAVSTLKPKYIFFLHWNWLVPETIWKQHECVCFHMTDVPYGRGGSPLQNLILAGHLETKLSALRMISEMDAGPVYTKKRLKLEGSAQEIYLRAGILSAEIIEWMIDNEPIPLEQVGAPVLFKRRKPEQSRLPEAGALANAYDFIRMLDAEGYPHAFIEYGEFILKLRKAQLKSGRIIAEVEINKEFKT